MQTTNQSLSTPVKMGIITGLVYCVLIFIENQFFYKNPLQFGASKFIFYLVILAGYFYTGWLTRKELGGFITFQECLKAILLAIAITELIYLIFSTVYVKYIDPTFIDKMKVVTRDFMVRSNVPDDNINEAMAKFNDAGKITLWTVIQSYGFAIIIDAVFGVIIALILKKPRPEFENSIQE